MSVTGSGNTMVKGPRCRTLVPTVGSIDPNLELGLGSQLRLGLVLSRSSARILRVEGTNITASEVSRKILGVVPHI